MNYIEIMIKTLLILGTAFAMMLSVSGCGHNGLFIAQGTTLSLNEAGFHYVRGTAVYDLSRENSEMITQINNADGIATAPSSNQLKGSIVIQRKISKQITRIWC